MKGGINFDQLKMPAYDSDEDPRSMIMNFNDRESMMSKISQKIDQKKGPSKTISFAVLPEHSSMSLPDLKIALKESIDT